MGGFCLVVEFNQIGTATNKTTPYSFYYNFKTVLVFYLCIRVTDRSIISAIWAKFEL